jgi:hypothetical protein
MYSARRVVRRNPATDLPQVKRKCESPLEAIVLQRVVHCDSSDGLDGAHGINEPRTLEFADATEVGGGRGQDLLYLLRTSDELAAD